MSDKSRKFAYGGSANPDAYVRPFRKGDYDGDVALFTQDIERDPANPVAYENRGHAHHLNDDFDDAIVDYSRAIQLDPGNPRTYTLRAAAYEDRSAEAVEPNMEDLALAVSDYGQAIRLAPNDGHARLNRGRVLFRIGRYDDAVVDFSNAITFDPEAAYHWRGRAQLKRGDYDAAIADFTKAISLDPTKSSVFSKTAHSHVGRGEAWAAKADFDRAVADFDAALRLGIRNSPHLFWNRGLSHKAKGEFAAAIADFEQALRLPVRPIDKAAVLYELGHCHLVTGDAARARSDFEEAVRLNPSNEAARKSLGSLHRD